MSKYSKNRLVSVQRVVVHNVSKSNVQIVDRHTDTRRGKDKLSDDDKLEESAEIRTMRYYVNRLLEESFDKKDIQMIDSRTVCAARGKYEIYLSILDKSIVQCEHCAARLDVKDAKHREFCDAEKKVSESEETFDAEKSLDALLTD